MRNSGVPPGGVDHVTALLHNATPPSSRQARNAAYAEDLRQQMASQKETKRLELEDYHSRPSVGPKPYVRAGASYDISPAAKLDYGGNYGGYDSAETRDSPQIAAAQYQFAQPSTWGAQQAASSPPHDSPGYGQQWQQQQSHQYGKPAAQGEQHDPSSRYQAHPHASPERYQHTQVQSGYQPQHGDHTSSYSPYDPYATNPSPSHYQHASAHSQSHPQQSAAPNYAGTHAQRGPSQYGQQHRQQEPDRWGRPRARQDGHGPNDGDTSGLLTYLTHAPTMTDDARKKATYRCAALCAAS